MPYLIIAKSRWKWKIGQKSPQHYWWSSYTMATWKEKANQGNLVKTCWSWDVQLTTQREHTQRQTTDYEGWENFLLLYKTSQCIVEGDYFPCLCQRTRQQYLQREYQVLSYVLISLTSLNSFFFFFLDGFFLSFYCHLLFLLMPSLISVVLTQKFITLSAILNGTWGHLLLHLLAGQL